MKSLTLSLKIVVPVILSVLFMLGYSCNNREKETKDSLKSDLQNAEWITDAREMPLVDSLMYGDFPAPLFRKEFSVKKEVKSATLFITAAGYYSASVNGKVLDKNISTRPGPTSAKGSTIQNLMLLLKLKRERIVWE